MEGLGRRLEPQSIRVHRPTGRRSLCCVVRWPYLLCGGGHLPESHRQEFSPRRDLGLASAPTRWTVSSAPNPDAATSNNRRSECPALLRPSVWRYWRTQGLLRASSLSSTATSGLSCELSMSTTSRCSLTEYLAWPERLVGRGVLSYSRRLREYSPSCRRDIHQHWLGGGVSSPTAVRRQQHLFPRGGMHPAQQLLFGSWQCDKLLDHQ